ncbi:MAG: hypothetical protein ACLTKT_06800 [Clostridia bacterium]|nr:hypothetical protein [Clostridium sp.]MBS6252271.1 hypothetical protein [Clostridium sp.]
MNIKEVIEAQKVIAKAKKELAIKVKRRLENGGCFEASEVLYRQCKNRYLKTLKLDFAILDLSVSVFLYEPEDEKMGWSYEFSCKEIGLDKIPPTGYKEGTAKGNIVEVKYKNARQKQVRKNIILKEFYDSNEHVRY